VSTGWDSISVLLQLGGTWVDVSGDVDWDTGYELIQGGSSRKNPTEPSTLSITLVNVPDPTTGISPWTPDNPLSPHYPHVAKGVPIRVVTTRGDDAQDRYRGWVTAWVPAWGESAEQGTVTITASDVLGILSSTPLDTPLTLQARHAARAEARPLDMWTWDDGDTAQTFTNRGLNPDQRTVALGADMRPATSVACALRPTGTAQTIPAEGAVNFPTALDFTRDDNSAGTVVVCPLQDSQFGGAGIWWRIPPANFPSSEWRVIASGWSASGRFLWELGVLYDAGSGY